MPMHLMLNIKAVLLFFNWTALFLLNEFLHLFAAGKCKKWQRLPLVVLTGWKAKQNESKIK